MPKTVRAKLGVGAFFAMMLSSSCALLVSTGDLTGGGTGSPDGSQLPDGSSGSDSAAQKDAGANADALSFTYNDFTDSTNWASFDLSPLDASATSYSGAVSDGKYLYLAPFQQGQNNTVYSGALERIDLTADFTSISAWTTFNTSTVATNAVGFNGSVFDGRYMYLAPSRNASGNYSGLVARYDTQAALSDISSWTTFDTQPLSSDANGYAGGGFDGRYVYLGPQYGDTARYDTQAAFTSNGSWTTVEVESVAGSSSTSISNTYYDGARYLYFLPSAASTPDDALRYDTQGSLTDGSSWKRFDVKAFGPVRVSSATTDGRYVYFTPIDDSGGNYSGLFLRYDTTADFGSAAAWASFDLTTLDSNGVGYGGAVFDGRYVYFAPYSNDHLARYDTTLSFTDKTSWKTQPLDNIRSGADQMGVAYFDGKYIYFFPGGLYAPISLRFEARTPK